MIMSFRKHTYAIIFFLFAYNCNLCAQGIESKLSGFSFDLVTPFYTNAPRYTFGYYQSISNKWLLTGEYGTGKQGINLFEGERLGSAYRSEEYRFQVLHKLTPANDYRASLYYIGLEIGKLNHTDIYFDRAYTNEEGNAFDYDSADYERSRWTVFLQGVHVHRFTKSLGLQLNIGFGLKDRKVTFDNIDNPEPIRGVRALLRSVNLSKNGWHSSVSIGARLLWNINW